MSDDSGEPESKAGEAKPPKIKAEDNPWYLLATLYGEPEVADFELQEKNRVAWNRYFAAELTEKTRTKLIEEKRHPPEELTPYSPVELQEMARAFAERCKAFAKKPGLPASNVATNFSNVEFEQYAFFGRYLFSTTGSFWSATFFGGANFIDATFFRQAPFRGAAFSGEADFSDAAFSGGADFSGATFPGSADFRRATFSLSANFEGATFSQRADFSGTTFSQMANFSRTTFSAKARFESATFSSVAEFYGAKFSGVAEFVRATFSRGAIFKKATFKHAIFESATFSHGAMFAETTFRGLSLFVNAEMKGIASFENATFETEPPRFSGAKLHEGTIWRGIKKWPTPKKVDEAGAFIDAYERLKLEMNRLQKHEDELDFFALELQSRRVWLGTWRGLPIAIYGAFSDYGRSYLRPPVALFYLALIGTLAFLSSDSLSPWQSLGLSIANTLNVLGFRKDFFDAATIECLPALLKILSAVQTIFGTILLFLFGLVIRNKFRMK